MTFEDANRISIKEYLKEQGISPVQDKGYYGMFRSPFREDMNPSMKVDYNQNLWYDFGSGEGGSLIDLIMRLHDCNEFGAITKLEKGNYGTTSPFVSFQGKDIADKQSPAEVSITKVQPLQNIALLNFLSKERGINTSLIPKEVQEIYYKVKNKSYFAVAFPNNSGGYEIRNQYFKGCISPKDITLVKNNQSKCMVFEGFMDYLSFLTLRHKNSPDYPDLDKQDYLILNSVNNLPKAMDILGNYERISSFLDNDAAGYKACQQIQNEYGLFVSDQSVFYRKYKDLNDCLCDRKSPQPEIKQENKPDSKQLQTPKRNRGRRM